MNREEFKAEQNSTPNKIVLNNVIKRTEQNRTDEKSRTRQTKKKTPGFIQKVRRFTDFYQDHTCVRTTEQRGSRSCQCVGSQTSGVRILVHCPMEYPCILSDGSIYCRRYGDCLCYPKRKLKLLQLSCSSVFVNKQIFTRYLIKKSPLEPSQ